LSAVGYARLTSGRGLVTRWHVSAAECDHFRAYDALRAAEHTWLLNDMRLSKQTPPQGVDVIVGRHSINVDGSYHSIAGQLPHGAE